MTFQLQENDIQLLSVGDAFQKEGSEYRPVTFSIKSKEFTRDILTAADSAIGDNLEEFYLLNKEQIDSGVTSYLSETQIYDNQ